MTDENDSDEILTQSSSVVMPRPTGRNSDVPLPIFHLSKAVVPGKGVKMIFLGLTAAADFAHFFVQKPSFKVAGSQIRSRAWSITKSALAPLLTIPIVAVSRDDAIEICRAILEGHIPPKITKCKVRGNASAAHQVRQGVP